jgi:hypothetical protein
MNWAYILGILGVAIVLYLISSLRVLRQYERGLVFLLGKFERCARQNSRSSSLASSRWRVYPAHCDDANPLAKHHRENVSIDIAAVAYRPWQ